MTPNPNQLGANLNRIAWMNPYDPPSETQAIEEPPKQQRTSGDSNGLLETILMIGLIVLFVGMISGLTWLFDFPL